MMEKFLTLLFVAVSANFVVVTEGKQYMDLTCHPGFNGEARALEIEKECRETDSSGTDCYKMCVLKGLGFIDFMNGDENSKSLYLKSYNSLKDNIHKLFSPEALDVAEKLRGSMYSCGDYGAYLTGDTPCGSSTDPYSLYNCLEEVLSCSKQYIDLTCHSGYIGEARALEIEKDCRQIDVYGTPCFKKCVLKGLGFINYMNNDETSTYMYLHQSIEDNVNKLFSPEAQDVAKNLSYTLYGCGDLGVAAGKYSPCGSRRDSLYTCLEKRLSC